MELAREIYPKLSCNLFALKFVKSIICVLHYCCLCVI